MSKHGIRGSRNVNLTGNYILLILIFVFSAGPLVILLFNSLKGSADFGRNPLGFPATLTWSNFTNAWVKGNFSTTLPNTIILVAGTVVGTMILSAMAAYSMAKLKLPGADGLTMYFLVISSLPMQLFLVPLFYLWRRLGLINNLFGLILIYVATNCAFAIFLLRSYMIQIPADFEDAARVDGANEWQVFSRVVIPLSWPSFLTTGLVTGLNVWNEFMLATIFLTKPQLYTVVTSFYNFSTSYGRDWGLTSAAAIMMILPILALFLMLQRQFIEGLTQGGLKG
jgi:raffinose/stachyose/melibiose transport system permease protein